MELRLRMKRPQTAAGDPESAPMTRPARFSALLIAPNRSLGGQLLARTGEGLDLAVTHQLDSYPSLEALATLVGSGRPDLVFVDLATDLEAACGLIRTLAALHPDIYVVGLDQRKDSETLMKVLREGATEFLHSPFEPAEVRGAPAVSESREQTPPGGAQRAGAQWGKAAGTENWRRRWLRRRRGGIREVGLSRSGAAPAMAATGVNWYRRGRAEGKAKEYL